MTANVVNLWTCGGGGADGVTYWVGGLRASVERTEWPLDGSLMGEVGRMMVGDSFVWRATYMAGFNHVVG